MSAESRTPSERHYPTPVYFCDSWELAREEATKMRAEGASVSIVEVQHAPWQIGREIRTISKLAVVRW